MKKCMSLLILIILFSLILFTQGKFQVDKLKELNKKYFKIQKLIADKNYKLALGYCQDIIKKNVDYDPVYMLYAELSRKMNGLDDAIKFLKGKLSQVSYPSYIFYGLGLCYESKKDMVEAIKNFKKAIDLKAPFQKVYKRLAYYFKTGSSNNLIKYFEDKLKIDKILGSINLQSL